MTVGSPILRRSTTLLVAAVWTVGIVRIIFSLVAGFVPIIFSPTA